MKVSIIVPVLNSPEAVRRHILYWGRMGLPDDVEILIMDDGSEPPLEFDTDVVTIHKTGEARPWTSSIARNKGARIATGRNLIMADVDYIIPEKLIMEVRDFTGQKMQFKREFAVLDEHGNFTQNPEVLMDYGLLPSWYQRRGVSISPHPNVYAMNREVFLDTGGYDEDLVRRRNYPQGEDNLFKRRWAQRVKAGLAFTDPYRPTIYMFPVGQFCGDVDHNPKGLFHNLSRKTRTNVFWKRQLAREKAQ